jgi:hypothetical protein
LAAWERRKWVRVISIAFFPILYFPGFWLDLMEQEGEREKEERERKEKGVEVRWDE